MPIIKIPKTRNVITGKYTTETYGKKNPDITVRETDKIRVKKKPKRL